MISGVRRLEESFSVSWAVDSERDAPCTACGETPQPRSLSGEGCGIWDSGFIGGWGLVVVAAIATGVAGGAGGFSGADVFGGGDVPCFACLAVVGTEERGIGSALFDEVGAFPGRGFAEVAGFPAEAGDGGVGCGGKGIEFGLEFLGIDGVRWQSEFAEQFVDALVRFGFHRVRKS